MPSIEFLKNLSRKLQTGDSRSIHLNALPGRYATRLDIGELKIINGNNGRNVNAADQFIEFLTTKPSFNFKITYSKDLFSDEETRIKLNTISRRLNSMYYEDVDSFLEHGIKNFGFGYPILIKRDKKDPAKIIKAPVFIWNLDIEKSNMNQSTWFIKREDEYPIYLNQVLFSHIKADEGIELKRIREELLDDSLFEKKEIIESCDEILSQLNSKGNFYPNTDEIALLQSRDDVAKLVKDKTLIYNGGLFGIYRTQKESIIADMDYIISNYSDFQFEKLIAEKYQTSSISAVDTDPSQEEILNSISKHKNKIIQGPPGTGKSQTLTSLITNALDNNAKCLVVCEKKTALQVIYNNLAKLGLADMCAIIDDVSKDRKKIIDSARAKIDKKYSTIAFKESEYKSLSDKYENLKRTINEKQRKVRQNILGEYNWKELIGMKLSAGKKSNIPANTELGNIELKFTIEEFKEITDVIDEAQFLLRSVKPKDNPFGIFKDDIFLNKFDVQQRNTFEQYLNDIFISIETIYKSLKRLNEIEPEYHANISKIENDKFKKDITDAIKKSTAESFRTLETAYNEKIEQLKELTQELKAKVVSFRNEYEPGKNDFPFNIGFGLRFGAIFNSKKREKKDKISELLHRLREIEKLSRRNEYYDAGFTEFKSGTYSNFKNSVSEIDSLNEKMSSFKNILENIHDQKTFIEFERSKTLTEYNRLESIHKVPGYFDFPFTDLKGVFNHNAITKSLSDYYNIFQGIAKLKNEFRPYFEWRNFLLRIDPECRKIIDNLIAKNAIDLKSSFTAWYINKVLMQSYGNLGDLLTDERLITDLMTVESAVKIMLLDNIIYQWETRQYNSIQKYPGNIKSLFNYRANNQFNRRNSLRTIISKEYQLFTDLFPVVLINPVVCSSIMPMKEGIFDIVIFDEASQLRIEDTFAALIRGKYKIVSGDKHQMPPSSYFQADISIEFEEENEEDFLVDSESLLAFAQDYNYISTSLDFHYRSRHPALIDFSNHAFYGSRLMPLPARRQYNPFVFYKVNSIYGNSTNEGEARKIIEILKNEITEDTSGNYPSIGIATMNITQRNLILDLISEECYKDQEFELKFEKLLESGLFVKNLENIQGDERDIIIISTTFGLNSEGRFLQNFGPINREKGYRLLNVIITRAKYKLYLCTSIPETYYNRYNEEIEQHGNVRKGIFYAYIAYLDAVCNDKIEVRDHILNLLRNKCTEVKVSREESFIESPFEQEVYDYLKDYISPDKIKVQHKVGGFRIDFAIFNGNSRPIALECDGKTYHSSEEAYSWDMYRQKQIEQMGFVFYRIWSTNWWIDPINEINKLVKFVEEQR